MANHGHVIEFEKVDHPPAGFDVLLDRHGRVGIEAAGAGCTLVPSLIEIWIAWTGEFIDGTPEKQRIEAETAIAVVDGLLLLRQLVGPESAERAARRIGIR